MSDLKDKTIRYSNGDITILWKPGKCIHSGNCARGLPAVFDPKRRPWIDANAETSEKIIDQVAQCPSGALSILKDEDT